MISMFAIGFLVPVIFIAAVWGYILLNIAVNSKDALKDDLLSTDKKLDDEAMSSLRTVRLMSPILFIVVGSIVLIIVNIYHPILRISTEGLAFFSGGFLFAYIGFAVGMVFAGTKENPQPKDERKIGRVFMIIFMGVGIFAMILGALIGMPEFVEVFNALNYRCFLI